MNTDENQVIVTGRLTKTPELKVGKSNRYVTTFSIANSIATCEESVSYFDIRIFGDLAKDYAKILKKGYRIRATGQLFQQKWKNNYGRMSYKVIVVASNIKVMSKDKVLDQEDLPGLNNNNNIKPYETGA